MSIDRLATRSGGVIGTIGPIRGSGVFSLQERYALTADNYEDVSLYLKMNGVNGSTTFYDSSLYGHTVTAYGDAQISTAQSKFGGASAYFDGTGDWLSVPHSTGFSLGSDDFSIEAWIYPSVLTGAASAIVTKDGLGLGTRSWIVLLLEGPSTVYKPYFAIAGGATASSNQSISTGQWTFISICRTGGNIYFGVNGTVDSDVFTSTIPDNSVPIWIGAQSVPSAVNLFNGYIDDLRITKGVARWTGNYTPPQREFLP